MSQRQAPETRPLALRVSASQTVSALLLRPVAARACYVFAHGAGAGMNHSFMADFAAGLAARSVATLRYQFPFMERGSRRPDAPALAHATVRAAVAEAQAHCAGLPLFAGGKSFGGRMTSQAQAKEPLPDVRGLVFVGFPLHPAGKPSLERAEHLSQVDVPMLFLQGTRDELADVALVNSVIERLGARATLALFDDADHAFHVRASSGRNDAQVREAMLDRSAEWIAERLR
jgi:predicted alpha/beta-hydrolase family hydrolase